MRKRIWIGLGLLVMLGLAWAVLAWASREPTHRGKKLGEWLDEALQPGYPNAHSNLLVAFRGTGPAGLEWLVSELDATDSSLKRRWLKVREQVGLPLSGGMLDRDRKARAARGFSLLMADALPALPALLERLGRPETAIWAAASICGIFPDKRLLAGQTAGRPVRDAPGTDAARPAVLTAASAYATNREPIVRACAIQVLGQCELDERAVVPIMIQGLQDPIEPVRVTSAYGLGLNTAQPVATIPPLIQALGDSSTRVRYYAAEALGKYYRQARTAVPSLLKLRSDPSPAIRGAVKAALEKIDPEAAAVPDLSDLMPASPTSHGTPTK